MAIADEKPDGATEHLGQALALAREDGHRHNEALARHLQAFALLDELFEEHWKTHFLDGYAGTCRLAGLPEEALRLYRQALELAPRLGYRYTEALAHEGSAAVLHERDPTTAAEHRAAGRAIPQEPTAGT